MASSSLRLENIEKNFGSGHTEIHALKKLNFTVNPGEFVAVIGPSGSGKSTFLTIAGLLQTPTAGKVFLGDQDLTGLAENKRAKARLHDIGFILQSNNLVPFLKVKEQFRFLDHVLKRPFQETVYQELLTSLDIADLSDKMPRELSGGEKQRVTLAKALYNDPQIILADEPTAALDTQHATDVVKLLAKEAHTKGKACIMVTHDIRMVTFCDVVYQLEDGRLSREK